MATQFTGEIYEISADLSEPLVIDNFDIVKDVVSIAGTIEDYNITTVDGNLQISTAEGTILATIGGVAELSPYQGYNPQGESYLLSLENEFFSTYVESYFFEPIYPVQNPDVDELIASGQYSSYYDHFIKTGQFEFREDTFLAATEGNDSLYSVGYETVIVGVPITQAQYREGLDVVPTDTGTGQVDTFYGGAGKEAIFVLGNDSILNETAQSFYIGEGDADYALIKDFKTGDRIFLGSDAAGFTQEVVDGNINISKDGDLIAIVEGVTELVVREDDSPYSGKELIASPTASYTPATDGDDTIYPEARVTNVIGVPVTETEDGTIVATSTGAGTVDILYDTKEGTGAFYLGLATTDSPDTPQSFYLGNGDEDYALIKNFNPITDHPVQIAGKFDDYEVEVVDGNTRIAKDGDLVAIAENVTLIPEWTDGAYTYLYSADDEYFVGVTASFNETLYLDNNPDVKAAVEAGEYESGVRHFLREGLLEERYAFYTGTNGDDAEVYAVGNSYLVGVAVTGFDAATEQFTTESTGTGTVDLLYGTALTNKYVIGTSGESFYVGEGDADYGTISQFDPLKDYIHAAGDFSDYTLEEVTVEIPVEGGEPTTQTNLNISYQGDLVAVVNAITEGFTLEELSLDIDDGFALISPENTGVEPEPNEPPTPIFGSIGDDAIDVTSSNQLIFAGSDNDTIDATSSQGNNRIYLGTGDDTVILGSKDILTGQDGNDRFFAQTGGDNILTGGMGADQFWIASAEIPESANIVTDFTLGEDVLGIAGLGASFESLTLTQQDMDALIAFDGSDLAILKGIQVTDLTGDSFAFV